MIRDFSSLNKTRASKVHDAQNLREVAGENIYPVKSPAQTPVNLTIGLKETSTKRCDKERRRVGP